MMICQAIGQWSCSFSMQMRQNTLSFVGNELTIELSIIFVDPYPTQYLILMLINYCMHLYVIFVILIIM